MAILVVKIEPRFPNFLDKRERTVNKVLEWVGQLDRASGLTQFLPFSPKLRPEMAGLILPFVDVVRENVVPKFANDILVRLSWFSGVTSPVIPDVCNFCQIIFGIITWFDVKISHTFDDEFISFGGLKVVCASLAIVYSYTFAF